MSITSVAVPYSTAVSGIAVSDASNILRIKDIRSPISALNILDSSFYRLLTLANVEQSATSPKYEWVENDLPQIHTFASATSTAGDTTIDVDDGLLFNVNSLFVVERTGELCYVTSISSNELTCTRGFASSTAAAIEIDDKITILDSLLPEGEDANNGNLFLPTAQFNYVQFFSETFQVTDLQDNTSMLEGTGKVPEAMAQTIAKVQQKINKSLIHSKRGAIASPTAGLSGLVYTTDGFLNKVTTNVLDLGDEQGGLTWPVLNNILRPVYQHTSSSNEKTALCGVDAFAALTREVDDRFNSRIQREETLGGTISRVMTDEGGMLNIMLDRFGPPADTIMIVDFAHVSLVEHEGFEGMIVRQNVQTNKSHTRQDEIYGSASLKVTHEETQAVITGISSQF